MGSRVEKHLSRLAVPKTWKIQRKTNKWITRPKPGPHSLDSGLPLNVLIRDMLQYAHTSKEVKNVLNNQEVLVDGKRRKEQKLIVGLMDVVSIPSLDKHFRLIFNKKGVIEALPIKSDEAKVKPSKIIGKTVVKKGIVQLNLFDSRNILVKEDSYKVGDTVLIELPSQKIKEHLKLEKGAAVYLAGGKHIGEVGVVEDIKGDKLAYRRGKETFETSRSYAFVIGKEKPLIHTIQYKE